MHALQGVYKKNTGKELLFFGKEDIQSLPILLFVKLLYILPCFVLDIFLSVAYYAAFGSFIFYGLLNLQKYKESSKLNSVFPFDSEGSNGLWGGLFNG